MSLIPETNPSTKPSNPNKGMVPVFLSIQRPPKSPAATKTPNWAAPIAIASRSAAFLSIKRLIKGFQRSGAYLFHNFLIVSDRKKAGFESARRVINSPFHKRPKEFFKALFVNGFD